MPYKALTYVMVGDEKKAPGDSITKQELEAAGQNEDNIEQLLKGGAISEDMAAEVHKDHRHEAEITAPDGSDHHVIAAEMGTGGDNHA